MNLRSNAGSKLLITKPTYTLHDLTETDTCRVSRSARSSSISRQSCHAVMARRVSRSSGNHQRLSGSQSTEPIRNAPNDVPVYANGTAARHTAYSPGARAVSVCTTRNDAARSSTPATAACRISRSPEYRRVLNRVRFQCVRKMYPPSSGRSSTFHGMGAPGCVIA
jgi:hypothetical protein